MPAVNLITALPNFVTKEEHTTLVASTPSSFNDIPPVIRHKEENVSVTLDPPLENFSNQNAVQGTLYVLTSVLAFMSTTGAGFQIEYPAITLHAVSRGESGPSIYCQLDESIGTENGVAADDDAVTDMRELTIVPQNPESLEAIFEALSQCASLHPDPQGDEDDLDEAFVDLNGSPFETFNGDENEELSEVGRVRSDFLNDNRFAPY
ncbi:regulator of volume decrease after cellular swelling-domain-containing protein [Flammula alnicola]|nr:regulator of volume decrease after cellular swelling-domain-containing protein [Flammula alnicola]